MLHSGFCVAAGYANKPLLKEYLCPDSWRRFSVGVLPATQAMRPTSVEWVHSHLRWASEPGSPRCRRPSPTPRVPPRGPVSPRTRARRALRSQRARLVRPPQRARPAADRPRPWEPTGHLAPRLLRRRRSRTSRRRSPTTPRPSKARRPSSPTHRCGPRASTLPVRSSGPRRSARIVPRRPPRPLSPRQPSTRSQRSHRRRRRPTPLRLRLPSRPPRRPLRTR